MTTQSLGEVSKKVKAARGRLFKCGILDWTVGRNSNCVYVLCVRLGLHYNSEGRVARTGMKDGMKGGYFLLAGC